jgi:hypothetical protein
MKKHTARCCSGGADAKAEASALIGKGWLLPESAFATGTPPISKGTGSIASIIP